MCYQDGCWATVAPLHMGPREICRMPSRAAHPKAEGQSIHPLPFPQLADSVLVALTPSASGLPLKVGPASSCISAVDTGHKNETSKCTFEVGQYEPESEHASLVHHSHGCDHRQAGGCKVGCQRLLLYQLNFT